MLSCMLKINRTDSVHEFSVGQTSTDGAANHYAIGGCPITTTGAVRNLGVTMGSCLDCNAQVSTNCEGL